MQNYQTNYSFRSDLDIIEPEKALLIYEFMVRLRMIEEAIIHEYHPADEMKCPIHFCVGQEAVPAVLSSIVSKEDSLLSHHRSHGHYLAKGCSLDGLLGELYGKSNGSNKGLAGSQDISSSKDNFYSGAILTGSVGIATGIAYAKKMLNDNSAVICCFGEAATDQGLFWESMNYASLKKLPILFICENNNYATYSHSNKRMANLNICEKVSSFGVKSKSVFGNDVISLYDNIMNAYNNLIKGPVFLEAMTYRLSSHVGPENDSYIYRTEKEVEDWEKRCPIKNFEDLIKGKLYSNKKKLMRKISEEIKNSFINAKKSDYLKTINWETFNISNKLPLEIREIEIESSTFHHSDTLPEPY